MKRYLLQFLILSFLFPIAVKAQVNNCPALPKKDSWDTLAYIKTEIPTDPAKARGIWLGQGIAGGKPGYIPTNHPGWAIGIAHAWNYSRNMNQRVEYPKIGFWMATLVQESELACAPGATWGAFAQQPVAYQLSTAIGDAQAALVMSNNGCYQIEGPGSAWSALGQGYPFNRFPATSAAYSAINQSPISGDVQPLMKAYYDLNTMHVFNYYKGWPMYAKIDCNLATDPYSYEKMTASAYNAGPNGFLGAYPILTGPTGCWTGLPATTAGYANDIAQRTAVFENNPGYCGGWMASSSFGSYYNANITWANVNSYLTNINVFYPEINFAVNVTPKVLAAFNAVNGGAAIPFKNLGPVVDAIILALPLERPNQVEGSPVGITLAACSGNILPFGHVEILDGSTTMCLGNSVTLDLVVENGGGTAPTYKWYKNSVSAGNLIGTNKTITITPNAAGVFVYCAQICNASGCYTVYSNTASACNDSRNINGFKVTVTNCGGCTFTASAASVNTPCKGMNAGTINLTLTNTPANYKVTYTGSTPIGPVTGTFNSTGSTVSIPNVRDGSYNIVLEDLSNSACKAYTNVVVGYTTLVNEFIDAVKNPAQVANDCISNVKATLKPFPASCNFKIKVVNYVFFQWENWVNAGIVTSTGINTLEKWTRIATRPEIDPWNDPPISEQLLTLNTGDKIDFYIALTTTPGASQLRAYTFEVYDETNTKVYNITSAAGSATSANPLSKTGTGYTVTCPVPAMPAYTYSWNPALTTMVNTATTSTGTIDINFLVPTTYTVTATHPTNSQCKLTDTVKVMPTCPTALPIVQLSLDAFRRPDAVDVVWSTVLEKDFSHYIVERSIDGQGFSEIGAVASKHEAIYPRMYVFTDEHPLYRVSYYRLKIINNDGSIEYSHAVSVPGLYNFSLDVYPNPFEGNTTVQINGINDSTPTSWTYQIIDMNGRMVESGQSMSYTQNIGAGLSSGVYVVEVICGPVVLKEKMVKY